MFRLTREVRFAINAAADDQLRHRPANSYAGYPSLTGLGHYFTLACTLEGDLDGQTAYLINIKQIDQQVRDLAIPLIDARIRGGGFTPARALVELYPVLRHAWPGIALHRMVLGLSPFLSFTLNATEQPMIRLSQKFEFAASHRLHNPDLSDEENRRRFGKCNNPHGHGHNYELQVTLSGQVDENGLLIDVPQFERIVHETVIEPFDHKNLNLEVPQFRELIPSVENIAMVIHRLLEPKLRSPRTRLAAVTVWETPKTWCEYSES
jgi:6-pyruvoyltetrahydropterin/6-carboxytetrahydropterin synthase